MTERHAPKNAPSKTVSTSLLAGAVALSIALGACSSDPVEVESNVVPATDETSTTVEETTTTSEAAEETTTTAADVTTTAAGESTTTVTDETTTTAAEEAAEKGDLDGFKFTLKDTAGEEVSATAGSGMEVDSTGGLRYLVDVDAKKITMTWDIENSDLDTLEGVVEPGDEDVYTFTFDKPVLEGVKATADTSSKLVPTVEVTDANTLVVTIADGMEIGDGFDAVINLS